MGLVTHMHGAGTKSPAGEHRLPQAAEAHLARHRAITGDRHAPTALTLQQYWIVVIQVAAPTHIQYHAPSQAPVLTLCMNHHRPVARDGLGTCVAQPGGK